MRTIHGAGVAAPAKLSRASRRSSLTRVRRSNWGVCRVSIPDFPGHIRACRAAGTTDTVSAAGLEPATARSEVGCAIRCAMRAKHEYPRPGSNRHVRCGTTVFETVASACFATGAWLDCQDLNLDLRGQNPTGCRLPHSPKGETWLDCQDLNLKLRVQSPAGCQLPHSPTSGSSRPCTDVSRVSTERPCHWTIEPRRWPESNRLGLALQASGWPFTFSARAARERLATCRAERGRRPSRPAPRSPCRRRSGPRSPLGSVG